MTQSILIIGAGFSGMWAALAAARLRDQAGLPDTALEITVLAPEPALHMRPRFYEPQPATMQAPLQALFDVTGVRFVQGRAERIDIRRHEVEAIDSKGQGFALDYDRLILAAGSQLFRPAIPGLAQRAFSIDQLHEATALDAHLSALAKRADTKARNTVIVAGGGFTGIEIAAELPARLHGLLGADADIHVVIVEKCSHIGPELGAGPRPEIERALDAAGVSLRLGSAVASVEADSVTLTNGERIASQTVIWTAGLRATPLAAQIGGDLDRFGRLIVQDDLRVRGIDEVFATGDAALAATDDEGNYASMSCQHAMSLGRYAGHNAAADLLGLARLPYRQPKYVTCLDLGPWGAVYCEGWNREVKLAGDDAKRLKQQINGLWIYPPRADRSEAFAAADPATVIVA